MKNSTLKNFLYSISFVLINVALVLLYFMLPDLNAPRNKWEAKDLGLMQHISNKIFFATTILLGEIFLFNYYMFKNRFSLKSALVIIFTEAIFLLIIVRLCSNFELQKLLFPTTADYNSDSNKHCSILTPQLPSKEYNELNNYISPENLQKHSAREFILYLTNYNIDWIVINNCSVPENWIKEKDIPELMPLLNNLNSAPTIINPYRSITYSNVESTTVSVDALLLINSYILNKFPCDIIYDRSYVSKWCDSLGIKY